MSRSRSRSRSPFDVNRRQSNLITVVLVAVVLAVGVWLLVKAADFGDNAPRSAVN